MNLRLRHLLAPLLLLLLGLFLAIRPPSPRGNTPVSPPPPSQLADRPLLPILNDPERARPAPAARSPRSPDHSPGQNSLATALAAGVPLRVTLPGEGGGAPQQIDLQVRPMRALADQFQITVGVNVAHAIETNPSIYEGWAFSPEAGIAGRTTVALVDGAFSAVIRDDDDTAIELKTDPESGEWLALRYDPDSLDATCAEETLDGETIATMRSDSAPSTAEDWKPATIEPQWGTDPATGEITKYEEPIPNGHRYDLSLPDATVMVVLAKDATGSDSATNLASKASTYLARMANVATIWENQLGIRLLVSELILTPNTAAYEDVGATLSEFRSWGNTNRPRSSYPRSVAARFGNLGFSGSVIGIAYVGVVTSSSGYSINKTGFNFTLVAHEMGHNFGTGHSAGGVMNSGYQGGQRDFYRDVSTGETAAKDIYDHSKSRLFGPATLRHAEEFAFARDDSLSTAVNTPLLFNPLLNDEPAVRNGATNSLSIAEVSRVYPIDAGTAELAGDFGVFFSPAPGYEGYAWFSYSLQGDVGNNGAGWLHRGDVAVLVGTDPSNNSNLVLAPGETVLFDPPGSGSASVPTQALQSRIDVTRDDSSLLVIRTRADATGTDSFVVRRSSTNYTINLTYQPRPPVSSPDVVMAAPSAGPVRFNPMSNDHGVGYRRPQQIDARIGYDGSSVNYFPNAFRLVSATNLDPAKGTLTLETLEMVANGTSAPALTGFMSFVPAAGATGVAEIEYVLEDATGVRVTENAAIVLSLLDLSSPATGALSIPPNVGLIIEGTTNPSTAGPLSGTVATNWQTITAPVGATATFTDPQSVTTSVQFSAPGTYLLRVTASDDGFSTARELTVEVTSTVPAGENLGALVSLSNDLVEVASGDPFDLSGTLPAVSDDGLPSPPAATTTAWTQQTGPGPVLFGDPAVLATTATFPFPGLYTLRLQAHDGLAQTFDEVTLNYTGPGNGVPITTGIENLQVSESAPPVVINLFPAFEDGEDGDPALSYTLESISNPALFSSATISGDPEQLTLQFAPGASGLSELTVRATDSDSLFVETAFTVIVSNSPPAITAIPDQSLAEGQTLNLSVLASDPDHHGLTYSLVTGAPAGMSIDPTSGLLTWPTDESDGPADYPVVVTVTDDSSLMLSATSSFTVTVEEVNEPPLIAPIADITNFAQAEFSQVVSVNDPDLPANALSFSLDLAPPGATVDGPSRTIRWSPPAAGSYAFTIRVNDGGTPDLNDTESFTLEVANAAPTISSQGFSIPENSPTTTVVGTVVASDGDGNGVTLALTENPGGAFAIDPNSGLLTVLSGATLDFETNRTIALTVQATDDAGLPLSRSATITVSLINVNEAPSLADQSLEIAIGATYGSIIGAVAATDPEDDPLSYAIVSGNEAGIFAIDAQSGELRIVAQASLSSPPTLTISATDDAQPGLSDSGLVTLIPTQVLVSDPATARVLVPGAGSPATTWRALTFDDSSWTSGATGVGYERDSGYEDLLNTDVESGMYNLTESVWIRLPFTVDDPTATTTLTLRMKYDDGFAAYLNGQRVEARNAPAEPLAWNEGATGSHSDSDAIVFAEFDVSSFASSLVVGPNVLAIHGLNNGTTSSDMLIVPELVTVGGGTIGIPTLAELTTGSVDSLTSTTAVLRGELTTTGGDDPEIVAVWGTTDGGTAPEQWEHSQSLGVRDAGEFAVAINGLLANTAYVARFHATNSAGTTWSTLPLAFNTTATPELITTLIASGANARFLVPTNATDEIAWRDADYDDSSWANGPTGIGYENGTGYESLLATDVGAEMSGINETIYLRFRFSLTDPASLSALTLRMKYDDAYVAFLNGVEIARTANTPALLTWNAGAIGSHSDAAAVVFQEVEILPTAAGALQEGQNVLAIHGLNNGTGSSDLLFLPELIASFPETSYAAWIVAYPDLQGTAQFPDRNPDGDLWNNFLEYAFGLDPSRIDTRSGSGQSPGPDFRAVASPQGDLVEVSFRRRIDYELRGLAYEVQSSADLGTSSWTTPPTTMIGNPVPTGDGLTEVVTLRISAPPATRQFYRMAVSSGE